MVYCITERDSIYIFGGLGLHNDKVIVLNDLWKFGDTARNQQSNFPETWKWSRLYPKNSIGHFPRMFGHAIKNKNVIFSCERNQLEQGCNQTEAFIIPLHNNSKWRKVQSLNTQRCRCKTTFQRKSPLLACCGGYTLFTSFYNSASDKYVGYWLAFLEGAKSLLSLDSKVALFLVYSISHNRYKYYITKLCCPDGTESWKGNFDCRNCSAGSYSSNRSECFQCLNEITTHTYASTSISDCKRCSEKGNMHCKQGKCKVTPYNTMTSDCHSGYNRDNNGSCTVKSTIQVATLSSSG